MQKREKIFLGKNKNKKNLNLYICILVLGYQGLLPGSFGLVPLLISLSHWRITLEAATTSFMCKSYFPIFEFAGGVFRPLCL